MWSTMKVNSGQGMLTELMYEASIHVFKNSIPNFLLHFLLAKCGIVTLEHNRKAVPKDLGPWVNIMVQAAVFARDHF